MQGSLPPSPDAARSAAARVGEARAEPRVTRARFAPGDIVRHRLFDFRGVVFDIDPEFANSEEWYEAIPQDMRPRRDQPFYHLLAENAQTTYVAYVSEQNLLPDRSGKPVGHPQIGELFADFNGSHYEPRHIRAH